MVARKFFWIWTICPFWLLVKWRCIFAKRSYFALVIEVVSYEKGSDCHPHLLIGPLNTTIPSIPAKSSDFIHSINPQHKQDYFHISTFSQNWASKIKIFSAKIQMDLLKLAGLSKSEIFTRKVTFIFSGKFSVPCVHAEELLAWERGK